MPKKNLHEVPATGLKGLRMHWKNDLVAAFSVSLVALPLALGVAFASGAPPMSGIISGVIGGVVCAIIGGSYVGIKGPAAGLITVCYAAIMSLEDGSGRGIRYFGAVVFVSGCIQVLLGLFRLGKLGEVYPSSVIHGVLAAIGIIIFGKQINVALGTSSEEESIIGLLLDIPNSLMNLNPFVTIISLTSLLLLIFHSKISYKLFHFLPAPVWVLFIAVPFVFWFDFFETHEMTFLGSTYTVGPHYLIQFPSNILDSIFFADFSRMNEGVFWAGVISLTLISSIETLAIAKAVDKLDPYNRETDTNRDLMAIGVSTAFAGLLCGLPIITVIARSSVNISNHAKTRWSNLFHGVFLLVFVLLLAPFIQQIPLAALAAILVFTGYKLAAPRVFKHAYEQGMEQLLFLCGTLIITLFTDLLWGIIGGFMLTLLVHILLSRVPVTTFFSMVFKSDTYLTRDNNGNYELWIKGIANFLGILRLKKLIETVPKEQQLRVHLSEARLVDLTVLEVMNDYERKFEEAGGDFQTTGLDYHVASSPHPMALKSRFIPITYRLSPRERKLAFFAKENDWEFQHEVDYNNSYLRAFQFFEIRPIEYKANIIRGHYPGENEDVHWEIADITFDEGALLATEVYNTTVQIVKLPFHIPKFILEKEGYFDKIFDRVIAFSGAKDIDFQLFTKFSRKFLLKGEDEETIRAFFTPELIRFFEKKDIYHVESNGEALLIFKYLRLAQAEETSKMLEFSEALVKKLRLYENS
ncbi:MAG: SulP family inorganic anion transporter [Saprospiraceae bacterium]|nr:SulP family inorganic anion transporter [Saprospiraceae bacterium]